MPGALIFYHEVEMFCTFAAIIFYEIWEKMEYLVLNIN